MSAYNDPQVSIHIVTDGLHSLKDIVSCPLKGTNLKIDPPVQVSIMDNLNVMLAYLRDCHCQEWFTDDDGDWVGKWELTEKLLMAMETILKGKSFQKYLIGQLEAIKFASDW